MPSTRSHCPTVLLILLLAGVAAVSAGCSVLGLVAHATTPPPKVPPKHVLAPVPTIVLVESSASRGYATLDAQQIAAHVTAQLRENKLDFVLDSGIALEHQSRRNPDGSRLKPSQLARACGARQFIYVDLTSYGTTTAVAGEAADGQAAAAVWVVDADSAQPLWPPEANQGYPVAATVPFRPTTGGASEQAIRDQINTDLGQKTARLFHEWTAEQ